MLTILLIIGLICLILWIVGITTKLIPHELVTVSLVFWIICAVIIFVSEVVRSGKLSW
jgi:hypothetical protein